MRGPALPLATLLVLSLGACGGGSGSPAGGAMPAGTANPLASPGFHLAPVALGVPADTDADGMGGSAYANAHTEPVPDALADLDSAGLTPEAIDAHMRRAAAMRPDSAPSATGTRRAPGARSAGSPAPLITVFTPAQIRAAYALAPVPSPATHLTPAQAAGLGAGQTIYLVDAYGNPNAAADLATFDAKFGLPACAVVPITAATPLPLAAASAGCTFSVAYVGANGAVTDTAPAYDAGWATEIGMDVQWAHATAPLARIVLLEAQGASISQLASAIRLAGLMGPGVVSMSFGAGEGAWMASLESLFLANGKMSYLASTGDSGAGVAWPAASASVVAVGGTTLAYTGTGTRSEKAWVLTGGGISAYVAEPSYQTAVAVPGEPSAKAGAKTRSMRSVADVSFNADPNSGQYLVVTPAGASTPGWYSAGGTSIGVPQWAGLLAVANAQRALAGKAPLGQPQAALYKGIAAVKGLYAGAFLDVSTGRDGSCTNCAAGTGYDQPTGLGTPFGANLIALLAAY
jgi:subtilase family serine protease